MRKYIVIFSIILIGLLALAGFIGYNFGKSNSVGSSWHNATQDFSEGISVDGTMIIDGSGVLTPASITSSGAISGTNGVFSGTLNVTGASNFGIAVADTFTQGGGVYASSTSNSAETLSASSFDTENVIDYTLNVQDATLTLTATPTLTSFIPNTGDVRTIKIRNATTTAGMDLTIAGNTGVILKKATSSAVIYGDTDGANYAELTFTRRNANFIDVGMKIFTD